MDKWKYYFIGKNFEIPKQNKYDLKSNKVKRYITKNWKWKIIVFRLLKNIQWIILGKIHKIHKVLFKSLKNHESKNIPLKLQLKFSNIWNIKRLLPSRSQLKPENGRIIIQKEWNLFLVKKVNCYKKTDSDNEEMTINNPINSRANG